jgi:hypothetical protein
VPRLQAIRAPWAAIGRWQVITGWRRFSERLGGGASIFQDLDLGEALSAEAQADRGRGQASPGGQILRKLGMDETDEIGQPDGIDGTDQIDGTDGMCQCRHPP